MYSSTSVLLSKYQARISLICDTETVGNPLCIRSTVSPTCVRITIVSSVTREFRINDRVRVRPVIEFDNVLNKTVFSFGAEFINFSAFGPTATPAQRQAFLDSFMLTTRTMRPRQIRLGIRLDFL